MGIPDNELHPAYCVGLLAMHGASLLGGQPSVRRTIITGERLLKRTLRESNKSARCVALCRWREWAHVDRFRRCLQKARCFLARESSCWMAGCFSNRHCPISVGEHHSSVIPTRVQFRLLQKLLVNPTRKTPSKPRRVINQKR